MIRPFATSFPSEPDPPSKRAPDRGIPKAADDVVMRAIQKKPQDRFQSMREMIGAIRDVVPMLAGD